MAVKIPSTHTANLWFHALTPRPHSSVASQSPNKVDKAHSGQPGLRKPGRVGGPAPGAEVSSSFSKQWAWLGLAAPPPCSTQAPSSSAGGAGALRMGCMELGGGSRKAEKTKEAHLSEASSRSDASPGTETAGASCSRLPSGEKGEERRCSVFPSRSSRRDSGFLLLSFLQVPN